MADQLESTNKVRIIMWCAPRSISTALTKCLSAIDGMEIWFERFHFCGLVRRQYQVTYGDDIPMDYGGNEDKARRGAENYERLAGTKIEPDRIMYGKVKRSFEASTSKYILAKDIYFAFPDERTRQYLPSGCKHVFLIRDPYRMFSSYRKAVYAHLTNVGVRTGDALDEESFDMETDDPLINTNEIYSGYHDLWKYIRDNVDPHPIVVNADDLLDNPAELLSKLCHQTDLPYSDSLHRWDASPDIVKTWKAAGDDVILDGIAFYKSSIHSCRFLPPGPVTPREKLPPDVRRLADAAVPYFEEMNHFKI